MNGAPPREGRLIVSEIRPWKITLLVEMFMPQRTNHDVTDRLHAWTQAWSAHRFIGLRDSLNSLQLTD